MTTNATPTGRYYPAAVWTGSEMIVWGGSVGGYLADTWSYYPYAPALRIFQASPNSAVVSWPVWSTTFGLYQCSGSGFSATPVLRRARQNVVVTEATSAVE
jgi:hypothetical protein